MPPGAPKPGGVGETERYRILLEINNALIANLTREDLFRAIADAVRRVVPFDRTAIFLHDPDKDILAPPKNLWVEKRSRGRES
ncbi:MAG: hypothetical protein ACREKF_13865 [Candidatus Methylomirabilales bacterium]